MADITGAGACGVGRIRNDIAGFNVYVGEDALPDFTGTPTFSATLPVDIPIAPPVSGTKTYYVTVRAQDEYGLESQNQKAVPTTIDEFGEPLLLPLPTPTGLTAILYNGLQGLIQATYPNLALEADPADEWRVWVSVGAIDPDIDAPTTTQNVSGQNLRAVVGPLAAGTYNIAVALFRNEDTTRSSTATTTLVVPATPNPITAVPNGNELP